MKLSTINTKQKMITLQLVVWGVILGSTLFWSFGSTERGLDIFAMVQFSISITTFLIIYLFNYFFIIPRYLFQENRQGYFFANLIIMIVLMWGSYAINSMELLESLKPENMPPRPRGDLMFVLRNLVSYILMIGLVTAVQLAERLQKSEEALREAESARIEAELTNLRSQINPHFLLNTLNNIYALTVVDTEKAQETIKELSNLLRYVLYDNLNERVSLVGEVEFLKTYIQLMSIRLPRPVELRSEFEISPRSTTQIAPLIFISLIENAFKHSVSASGEGFIDICFEDRVESGEVVLAIKNSNHAKLDGDKSGHGIGLEQVRRRLELLYPNSYRWVVSDNPEIYSSTLTLKCNS